MCSLLTSCQIHPRLKLADYVLENYIDEDSKLTKFPSRLWAQPPDVYRAILHTSNSFIWTLNSMWNIPTCTCLSMYWRRFRKQCNYVAMNSLSQPTRRPISKREQETVCCCCIIIMTIEHNVLIRQQYLRQDAALSQGGPCDALYISKSRKYRSLGGIARFSPVTRLSN